MPILSLVIPTRNRTFYLSDCVRTALENTKDTEIVICDNSDTDEFGQLLGSLGGSHRVKYLYSAEKLNVIENFERGLAACSGDFIMYIGDDDSIGPDAESVAQWAKDSVVDCVHSYQYAFIASYFWPGVKSKYFGNLYSASMFINNFTGERTITNPIDGLKKAANLLGGGLGTLPRIYHGMVSRALVSKIQMQYGALFGGVSPDIYSAALIAANCKRSAHVDLPFVIPGASPKSAAGQGAARTDRGGLRASDHISRFGTALEWDPRIPEFNAPHTVWAYSLCQALKKLDLPDAQPSFMRLYACCFLYYRDHWRDTLTALRQVVKSPGLSTTSSLLKNIFLELGDQMTRVSNKVKVLTGIKKQLHIRELMSISAAYGALATHVQSKDIRK
jgi:Glycosyl transferase family 2